MSAWPHSMVAHDVHFAVRDLSVTDAKFGKTYKVFKAVYYKSTEEMFFHIRHKASGKEYTVAVRERATA